MALALVACSSGLAAPCLSDAAIESEERRRAGMAKGLIAKSTKPHGELRETVPIAKRPGSKTRAVLSLRLPTLQEGDRIRFNGEVTVTTTCFDPSPRCIGRRYRFDPHLRARIVIGDRLRAAGRHTLAISRPVKLSCGQKRPRRNHHCPLVIGRGSTVIDGLRRLPCQPSRCRMNMVLDAHHPRARGGEVVVIGADRPNGSVIDGKGRMNAAVSRAGIAVEETVRRTKRRLVHRIPVMSVRDQRVVYSQRLQGLRRGDVLLVRARQLTRIKRLPYFIGAKILVSTRRRGTHPTRLTRRIVSRAGTATETNGFNCTLGPSAFDNPCLTRKAGLALIKQTPRGPGGRSRPLFVNLMLWGFAKPAQATRAAFPPLRVVGGELSVTRLRAKSARQ